MKLYVAADSHGKHLKIAIDDYLKTLGCELVTVSQGGDFVDETLAVVAELKKDQEALGLVIDAYGVGPFMVATKCKGIIAAVVSDERSAYMTRGHNNSRLLTIGAEIVGVGLAKNIVRGFVEGSYDGGRHQIRVDMLNKMC
ncbi:galactose-6-phosphate isomerase subunit LacA [Streptococcus sp. NLN64]|uniref:galactose-6-phosphate isomerase subunit LacA n=1 Tax=Streptococcus sp. NLN64 TaxID=2822799 RepID=UPI0018CB516E|nr:galactose-6-phosphate isomerase subunit LacA [Streptococcus sp. NLN64]MBG9368084.1 galactose-6-phosphate isomerase subunit LacA [Streptococcus sp. NLN64]